MNHRRLRRIAILAAAGGSLLAYSSAFADSAPAAPVNVDEVVVTALRKEQKLQDVPAAVSVLTSDALAAQGAKDYRDYLNSVPGVNYSDIGYRGSAITIRGIADGAFGATSPLSAIYIDEAPVTEASQPTFDPSLYDVDRVEVLKGPQGTLYGGGAMGGAIRVILAKPDLGRFSGQFDGTAGGVDHGGFDYSLNAMVNAPIVTDKLGLRATVSYRDDDGYIDDVTRGIKNANTVKKTNTHESLRWKPDDATTVDLGFLYQKEEKGAPNFATKGLGAYQQSYVYPQTGPADTKLYSLTVNRDLGFASVVSATNYMDKFSAANIDATRSFRGLLGLLTGVTIPADQGIGINTTGGLKLFTQEVRLSSNGEHRLQWLVGGFYSHYSNDSHQYADLSYVPALSGILTGDDTYNSLGNQTTEQVAGFGEVTYNITDRLAAVAGLRVFDIKTSADSLTSGLLNGGISSSENNSHTSSYTQKYMLTFKATPDNLLYAQASQGFRPGAGNDPVPTSVCGADLALYGYTSAPTSYKPDSLWNYEIGSKNQLFNRRMTINAAAYYIDWNNIQNAIGLPTCLFGFVTNAGKAVSKGFDLETSIRPIAGLNIGGALAYTDAKLTASAPGISAQPGDPLPLAAPWSWSAYGQYDFPLNNDLSGFVRGDIAHQSSRWNGFRSTGVALQIPAFTTVNARVGISNGKWTAALFATNLFDERVVTDTTVQYDVLGVPREVGVNLRVNF